MGLIKDLLLKHFVQISLGCLFYFYYIGYASSILSLKDIFLQSYWLVEGPDATGILITGLLGFLGFNWLLLAFLIIFEIEKFLYAKVERFGRQRNSVFLLEIVLFAALIYLLLKEDFIIVPIIIFTFFSAINFDSSLKGITSSNSFKFFQGILIFIYLIFFPVIATRSSMIGLEAGTNEVYINSDLNVVTKIPLGLKDEKKIGLGYVNKLIFLNIKGGIVRFISYSERRIILLKLEDVIRMIREPFPRGVLKFEIGGPAISHGFMVGLFQENLN